MWEKHYANCAKRNMQALLHLLLLQQQQNGKQTIGSLEEAKISRTRKSGFFFWRWVLTTRNMSSRC